MLGVAEDNGAMSPKSAPFQYRPHQREAIDAILKNFRGGAEVVVLEGPTGIGKSFVNATVAAGFVSAYYTSPQVALVDQLATDPLLRDTIRHIVGKPNYECILRGVERGTTVNLAPCERGFQCPTCKGKGQLPSQGTPTPCPECKGTGTHRYQCDLMRAPVDGDGNVTGAPTCPYYSDKFLAAKSRIAVTTLSYLLLASTTAVEPVDKWGLVRGRFPPRELLIVDEAHGTADFLADYISLTLSPNRLRSESWRETWEHLRSDALNVRDEGDALTFLRDVLLPELRTNRAFLESLLRQGGGGDRRLRPFVEGIEEPTQVDAAKVRREIGPLESLIQSAELAVEDLAGGNPWAIDPRTEEDKLVLQPVVVGPFLRRRLWNRAHQILLTTATVLDPLLFLRELGLEGRPYAYLQVPSTFPPGRAPVIHATAGIGPLSMKHKAAAQPRALEGLCRILDAEPWRGIVHCHSYENAAYIRDNIPERYRCRLVFHESKDRSDVLDAWLADGRPDSVLVSVAMTDGLDLRGELARFAVMWKIPYPNLGTGGWPCGGRCRTETNGTTSRPSGP